MRTLLLFLLCAAASFAAPAPGTIAEAAKLLEELPPQHILREARAIVVATDSEFSAPKHRSPAELKQAEEFVQKAKDIVPRLRKLILAGSSVFDYPGLVARGEIRWSEVEKHYELYIGVYLRDSEGQGPYDMNIRFDAKGTIVEIKDVRWKS
ncbi:MAG: hypothetical protein V4773_17180 [Verrucomicrobiota bacterium]